MTNTIDHVLFRLNNEPADNRSPAVEKMTATLLEANSHLRSAALVLRNICIGLYPPFRDQGILITVQAITREFRERHNLCINLEVENHPLSACGKESDALTIAVSHVLTEALNNVAKHAPQARVCVRLWNDEDLYLVIADDGPGTRAIDLSLSELIRRGHLGIVGMHQCARYANGTLRLEKNVPQGTRLTLVVPLQV